MTIKDRYIGLEYFGTYQDQTIPNIFSPVDVAPYFATLLEVRTKTGGIKKSWFYTQDSNNPIINMEIELTEKGCGICKVTFSELSFPIEAEDLVRIYIANVLAYEGIVDNDVNISEPLLTAVGFWKRFEELTYTCTIPTGSYVYNILQAIVESLYATSGVRWNPLKINVTNSAPILELKYVDDQASSIIGTLVESCGANYYWGVDASRDFYVRRYSDTPYIERYYYAQDDAEYEKVSITEDYSKIEMTEASVYLSVPSSVDTQVMRIGYVGNEGNTTYPPLEVSKKVRRRVGKLTASDKILTEPSKNESSSSITARVNAAVALALDWAYEKIKSEAQKALTVKISNIDAEKYIPFPGIAVLVEGEFAKIMRTIVDCNTADNWTNVTLNTSGHGKDSGNSICLFASSSNSYYDFQKNVKYYKQRKVGFYCLGPRHTALTITFMNETTSIYQEFKFGLTDNELCYYDFEVTIPFRYVIFTYVNAIIYIDDIQVFCEERKQVTTYLKKTSIKWDNEGIECNAEGGNVENAETSQYEKLSRKIRILENINSGIDQLDLD